MTERILLVDDDKDLLSACKAAMRKRFEIDVALGGREALAAIEHDGPYAVIISDMRMPEMDGIQFLAQVQVRAPDTVRMMLTGNADLETAVAAVNDGNVFRFITKPCPAEKLAKFVEAGLKQYRLVRAEREVLEETLHGAVKVCTEILSSVDEQTYGRALKVRELVRPIARQLGIESLWQVEVAALLAEIGSATIPPVVLVRKRHGSQLTGVERDMLAKVPEKGHGLLASIPRLGDVARIVLYAQKHFDGSGLPNDGVAGTAIPVGARLLKIVADFVELEAAGESKLRAMETLKQRAGQYDPGLLETASAHLCPAPTAGEETTTTSQSVAFADIRVDDLLLSNVETINGVLVVQAGNFVTSTLLDRMRNFVKLNSAKEPIRVARRAVASALACK